MGPGLVQVNLAGLLQCAAKNVVVCTAAPPDRVHRMVIKMRLSTADIRMSESNSIGKCKTYSGKRALWLERFLKFSFGYSHKNWVRFVVGRRFVSQSCWNVYFSPRLLCHFDLALSANSTSWRIASEREGLSGCCFAQVSIADLSAGERRIADTGSLPVAGRPLFLFGSTFFIDMDCIFR